LHRFLAANLRNQDSRSQQGIADIVVIVRLQLSTIARELHSEVQPLNTALVMLVRAYQYSQDTQLDRWEFAIPVAEFRYAGVTISELRWLLFSGLALHARETIHANGQYRKYTRLDIRSLPSDACFILSDKGVKSLDTAVRPAGLPKTMHVKDLHTNGIPQINSTSKIGVTVDSIPHWDLNRLELKFQGVLVKAYKSLPSNQGSILTAFQEEKWPVRIDDPLPPISSQDSPRRLSDAIKQLNRSQENELLRFCGDGTGKGVVWKALH
jgi:hypothetical protein